VFATRPIKDLAVFGGDGDFLHTSQSSITLHELICNGLLHPQDRWAAGRGWRAGA
jgi:hypothetical protein